MATVTEQPSIKIVNGPSREELFDALRLFGEKRTVRFVCDGGISLPELDVCVNQLAVEDGSGLRWNGQGFIPLASTRVKFYFDTSRRKGWMKLLP